MHRNEYPRAFGPPALELARNETFTHTGNVVFAIAAGLVGTFITLKGIFYGAAAFASGMAVSALFIEGDHVDHEAARAGGETSGRNGGERHQAAR
jgi:hypothetical protein